MEVDSECMGNKCLNVDIVSHNYIFLSFIFTYEGILKISWPCDHRWQHCCQFFPCWYYIYCWHLYEISSHSINVLYSCSKQKGCLYSLKWRNWVSYGHKVLFERRYNTKWKLNYSRFIKVYGDSSASCSTIKKWAADFKHACTWKATHVKDVQK